LELNFVEDGVNRGFASQGDMITLNSTSERILYLLGAICDLLAKSI